MTVKLLNNLKKKEIVAYFRAGKSQTDLGEMYSVSRKTIHRVLTEMGELPVTDPQLIVTNEEAKMLRFLAVNNIDYDRLIKTFKKPAWTTTNIVKVMANLDEKHLNAITRAIAVKKYKEVDANGSTA